MKTTAIRLLRRDTGQNTFEYLLVIGLIVAPLAAALFVGFERIAPVAVAFICSSIDTAGIGSCFG
jgi:hypothetical protein